MIENIDGIQVKYCPRCEEHVPVEDFHKHKGQSDGLRSYCKPCHREYRREYMYEYHNNNREKLNQQHREYYAANREKFIQQQREYYQNNPDKQRQKLFVQRLNAAVYSGKITKPDECTLCGSTERIQGHHSSYEPGHELDVVWVCATCHASIHIQLRREQEESE